MRRKVYLLALLLMTAIRLSAQYEATADSIQSPPDGSIRMVGDYMLDMSLIMPDVNLMSVKLPSLQMDMDLLGPDATKDYTKIFLLPSQMLLSRAYTTGSYSPYGYGSGAFLTPVFLQTATFKLNGNMRLSTYGQYTLDGRRVPNPGALPWEKDNFLGGMELKFNKNFGIRIEVRQGRDPMYPH